MSTHVQGIACPGCEAKLLQAHPDLVSWFHSLVKPNFLTAHVSWSYRDQAEQEAAFAIGRTKLHFPDSAHNSENPPGTPQSRALDLFLLSDNGIALFPASFYSGVNDLNTQAQNGIIWGARFKALGDFDHFQLAA